VKTGDSTTAVARRQLCGQVVSLETKQDAIMMVTFSVRYMPKLYNENQMPLQDSLEMAVRRVEGWCEMATSLQGCESGSTGMSTIGSRVVKTVTENTSLCVIVICKVLSQVVK
jgi:hypothetical protein